MNKHTILVVEDEALIAANLVKILSLLGYTVYKPVATGEDAIRSVTTEQPDLVLMDIELIGAMTGIEAAEKIRAIADIPIVYLTAYTDDLRLKQARLTEPYGYIVKPAHSPELHATIEMAMYKHALDRKLRESEERNRSIVEALPGILFHFSADGRFIDCQFNKGDLLLLPPDQIIGKQVAEILPPDLAHLTERKIRETLDSGQLQTFEYSLTLQDQERFFIARMIASGINSVLAFIYDITERKRAENALLESEEKYRQLFDLEADAILLVDKETGNLIEANRVAESLYGYSRVEFLHMKNTELSSEPDETIRATQEAWRHIPVRYHRKKDGTIFPVEIRVNILHWQGRQVHLAVIRDITERKRTEENLAAELKRSQDQQAALGEISFLPHFFSGDVHGLSARLTEVSSGVLGVERASVWLFNSKGDELRCIDLYEASHNRHSYEGVLKRHEYVNEFDALSTTKYIDADDPLTDPRTAGYVKGYLKPNCITSMLDAVIRVSGQNLGVLCFEYVDRQHHWESDEIAFACQLADQIAITLLNRGRKLAEDALHKSETQLRATLESTADGILAVDNKGKVLQVSRRFAEIWKIPPSLLESGDDRVLLDFVLDQLNDPDAFLKKVQLLYDSDAVGMDILTFKDDRVFERYSSPMIMDGARIGRVWSFRDITGRMRAEKTLQESEERYRNVVEDQTEFICRFLPDGIHIFVNDAYCRYFDKKREEIIGHRFKPVLHPEDREIVARHIASITPDHPVMDIDQRIIMPDGSTRWQRWSDRAIFDPNGRVVEYQSVGRDITDTKGAEEALRQANNKLTLLSSITRHDINNQITVLMGYLTLLEQKQPDPINTEYFLRVSNAAKRISAMIKFTKEYEEIGVHAPTWQDCRTLVDTAAKQAPLGKVMLKNDLFAGAEVFADPLVVKVFYNLMDNAVRYGGKITTIRFSVLETGDDQVIVCEDDGDGIVAAEKERIFERGFGKNTGMGLALSREILSITGITITETGEPGRGARFEITVPKGVYR
jgi:PAS domain S-box-containing protein